MTDFEKELIHYIFHVQDADDDNLSAEVICRKLYKYGLIDRGRRYWRPKKRPKYRTRCKGGNDEGHNIDAV